MGNEEVISSINNNQIKALSKLLKSCKARRDESTFVIEGLKLFQEAKKFGEIIKVFVSESFFSEMDYDLQSALREEKVLILKDRVFNQVSDTKTPQGIMATVAMPVYTLNELLKDKNPNLLILEDLRDPGNLGTMIRTAEAAGVGGIVLNSSSVDIFNPKVIRSTMGSIFRVPFHITDDLYEMIQSLKNKNISVYATSLEGKPYDEIGDKFKKGTAIIIGNESKGISENTMKNADTLLNIPMEGEIESLNAAMAAGILIYEIKRQRS